MHCTQQGSHLHVLGVRISGIHLMTNCATSDRPNASGRRRVCQGRVQKWQRETTEVPVSVHFVNVE